MLVYFLASYSKLPQEQKQEQRTRYDVTQPYAPTVELSTPWTESAISGDAIASHPRPSLYRSSWTTLNGLWTYSPARGAAELLDPPFNETLKREVRVPACIESGISGVSGDRSAWMWYKRDMDVSALDADTFKKGSHSHTLLHFDAIDYEAAVFVNGVHVGAHRGGYTRFTVDVTDALHKHTTHNEVVVFVHDPTDSLTDNIPLGKQRTNHGHMFFESCSGIWGDVWLERVPQTYISGLNIRGDKRGVLSGTVELNEKQQQGSIDNANTNNNAITMTIHDKDTVVATHTITANEQFEVRLPHAKLWSVSSPHLYNITMRTPHDVVHSYVGFRSVEKGVVDGHMKPLLNDEFVFTFAPLDEGYWPDGLYTPPSDAALRYDIEYLKELGFSGIRKHIKVEPDRFYYYTDTIGMLVWQDMPAMMHDRVPTPEQIQEFERQAVEIVRSHAHFPSIVTWVLYNEGWGQAEGGVEKPLLDKIVEVDDTRLIDAASGWKDHGYGDFHDTHHYSEPLCGLNVETTLVTYPDEFSGRGDRIEVNMEMGGVGHVAPEEHNWPDLRTYLETYEITGDVDTWNFRTLSILKELKEQVEFTGRCAGAVYTQTSDIESEVNGLLSYDRRFSRPDQRKWRDAIRGVYEASNSTYAV
ncbi:hypothetical protein E3P99_03685 [Wallemia hederae]|uniref:Glycoside hydrolase family 2 immunoglobulin-like beta-sandwich domain-containing protein n=1 Tax=Wallemia hederae TaxID=1540922 RepID=A0A4T0FE32_9BASI|nr:hypothetical protein E3P99_03685 [Wallemia hederae]